MNARLLLCLAALPAAVDALGEFHAEEVKTTCPTLVPLRLNQTNTAGSLMNTGTVAVLDSDYQGSDKPAVIVVQEWWGLNEEHIKKAQKLAGAGYRALVPDLYRGKVGVEAEEANHLMSNLDFGAAVQDICTIAKWAKVTGASAVGVTGFCMGGAVALCALEKCDEIAAGAPFYGRGGCFDPTTLKKPVLWSSGKLDLFGGFSDEATALQLKADLFEAGNKDYNVTVYEGVGHGFMNESPEPYATEKAKDEGFEAIGFDKTFYPYDADVANAAWGSLFDFFGKYL